MRRINEDELAALLKKSGLETTSDSFTQRLVEASVSSYKKQTPSTSTMEKWLGKGIISVLIFIHIAFLCYLISLSVQAVVFISLAAFIVGFYLLVLFLKKAAP